MATQIPPGFSISTEPNPFQNTSYCMDTKELWDVLYRVLPPWITVIFFFGLLGNLFALSIFLLLRKHLTVAEIYLTNLSVSDFMFVMGLPFWAESIQEKFMWPFGHALCYIINGVIKAHLFVSIFLVVAISWDRYCILVHTMGYQTQRSPRQAQIICAFIWFLGGLLSIPTFLFRSVETIPNLNISACVLQFPHEIWYSIRIIELSVVGFIFPLIAIIFFNSKIITSLRGRTKIHIKRSGNTKDTKATSLILTLVTVFIICWTPYHCFAILEYLVWLKIIQGCFWEELIDLGLIFANFFAFLNSCLNPVIFVFMGKFFRVRVCEVYKQCTTRCSIPMES
ncbi:LOW QUALITY PROTEIN: B1 bradykinin receptor [Sminthopsis crassicaudata]|uniref:LOW QUALITY PROTEIN: B1 bradykinin receptor n=1 Tax=Sminthopsis crassicaudata TaxID=9301 RepID=UPI003D68A4D5